MLAKILLLPIIVIILILLTVLISSFLKLPQFISTTQIQPIEKVKYIKKENALITLILTGDVMLGRTVMAKSRELNDYLYPFRRVASELNSADLVFVNLENPLIYNCPSHSSGFKFCATWKMVDGLVYAGVDVATVANNHALNYGLEGIKETRQILENKGILVTGLGKLVVKEVKATKFGFLGLDFVSNEPKEKDFDLVYISDKKVDILFIGVHWGVEYTDKPTSKQREWAKKLIEKGGDVVVGHHPHWVQSIEYINPPSHSIGEARPVYYSLGNFIFDQMWSEKTRSGLVMKLTFKEGKLVKEEKLPIFMSSWAQPEFIDRELN